MALIGTPATVPFWHVINGNALSLRSTEVSLESTSRDLGPANPRTVVLSVELMNSTLLPHLKACSSIHLENQLTVGKTRRRLSFHYRPQTKLRESYVFTGVCDSVHRRGVPGQVHPLGPGTPPTGTRYTPPGPGNPPRTR